MMIQAEEPIRQDVVVRVKNLHEPRAKSPRCFAHHATLYCFYTGLRPHIGGA